LLLASKNDFATDSQIRNDFIICESVAKFHGLICDLTLQTLVCQPNLCTWSSWWFSFVLLN